MPKLFDTLLIRLKRPICECPSARGPDKGAYGIFFPVDHTGLAGIKVVCKNCQKAITVPWDDLSGHVIYAQPKPKPRPEDSWDAISRGGNVVIRAGESGSPGRRVGRVTSGSAWAHAEQHWKDAERQFEQMAGRFNRQVDDAARRLDDAARQLERQQATAAERVWQTAPDVAPLFSQTRVEVREQKSDSSGSPHEPEPQREPEPADPPAEEPADTRPAYMKHLGLEEQK